LQAEGITFRGRRIDMKQHEHRFGRATAPRKKAGR
jgi:hypothetical protein